MTVHVEVSLTVPESIDAGETAFVDVEYELPEFGVDGPLSVVVALEVDGWHAGEVEQEAAGGDLGFASIGHEFATPGERTVTGVVTASDGDEEREGSATETVTVEGEARDDPVADEEGRAAVSAPLIEDGWVVDDETEERVVEEEQGAITVTGDAYTTMYAKESLRESVAEDTFDAVDQALMFFFTTWVEFSPAVQSLPDHEDVVAEIGEGAREEFHDQLEGNGLTSIEVDGTYTTDVAGGIVASVTEYEATYPLDDMTFEVTAGETITISGEPISIEALFAVWHDGEDVYIAGGAHPGENFEAHIEERFSEAIEVELDIDLGLEPEAYAEELRALIRSVE